MKDGKKILHNNIIYTYDKFYDRYQARAKTKHQILCSKCLSSMFSISYGLNECIATCVCGHSFTVYDG